MRIHNLGSDIISDYDYDRLKSYELEEVWYHYTNEGYEGWGKLLARKANQWFVLDLGHCSCNDPFDDLDACIADPFESLEAIKSKSSGAYWEELNNLLLGGMISQMGF